MSWTTLELGEICDIVNGSTPLRTNADFWTDGNINWFTIEDIRKFGREINETTQFVTEKALKDTSLKIVPVNTVLLCCTASVGEYAITKIPLAMNQQFNGLILKTDKVLPEFLFHYCSTLKDKLLSVSGSTTINFVAISKLKKITISFPSIATQQKIVEKLDAIFAEINRATVATEAYVKNAEALFQSYLTEIFDSISKSRLYKLDDVVTRLTNGYVGATKNIYLESGIPYLLARHVKNNVLTFDERTFISDQFNKKNKKSILKSDDVLLVQSGHIGHSAVVPSKHEGHNCHAMIVITTIKEILSGEFLSLYFQSKKMKILFEEMRTGSTIKHLNCGDVKLLMIPIPSREEQKNINAKAKDIKTLVSSVKEKMLTKSVQLELLRKAVLTSAFNGELVKELG